MRRTYAHVQYVMPPARGLDQSGSLGSTFCVRLSEADRSTQIDYSESTYCMHATDRDSEEALFSPFFLVEETEEKLKLKLK